MVDVAQCGPDEWYVCVEVRELALLRDGRKAPRGTPSRRLYYPCCYRDSPEIRPRAATPGAAWNGRVGERGPADPHRDGGGGVRGGGFAAVVSYTHIYDLGRAHGQGDAPARLLPLSADGLILAASLVLLHGAPAVSSPTTRPGP